MGRRELTRVIDGHTYEVKQLDPDTALEVLEDVTKILSPALASLASLIGEGGDARALLDTDVGAILKGGLGAQVAKGLAAAVDAAALKRLSMAFRQVTFVDLGKGSAPLAGIYAVHFQGRPLTVLKWLAFAVEVNFADFFDALSGDLVQGLVGKVGASRSQSTSGSGGSSGASS